MNAVETLEAAITKLEELRDATKLGDLTVTRFDDKRNEDVWVDSDYVTPASEEFGGMRTLRTAIVFDRSQGYQRFATAEYIVTLHQMVDPVVVILRKALATARRQQSLGETPKGPALDVARAILGES